MTENNGTEKAAQLDTGTAQQSSTPAQRPTPADAAPGAGAAAPKPGGTAPKPGGPKPGAPKPGAPRPGAPTPQAAQHEAPKPHAVTPAGAPQEHPHPVAVPVASDPSRWGRVDDDGTAWVKTAEGERMIGSWQAGDAAEGLAHFGRRYDDLATEIALLEARLAAGTDARKTKAAAVALAESLPTAAVIGDIDGLAQRLQAIAEHSDEAAAHAKQERERSRHEQTERKEALCAEAEQIATDSTQWKAAGDRLREILDEWKTIRGVDRKVDDALWRRFSKAREAFNRRRGAHFAELDRERAAAKTRKEELCARAEELSASTDWAATAATFRDLLTEWKAAGRAPREADDQLWRRFKSAQDVFFGARNAAASERDAEFDHNAAAKQDLLAAFEQRVASHVESDLDAARAALRELQDKWDAIGKVPRERMQDLEGRLRALEKQVRDAVDAQWRRTDPEAMARAAQFRERVAQFEEQAAKAQAAGRTRDAEKALEQATQWREWADAAEGAVTRR
jgi:uncharacterized protein DUF349